MNIFNTEVMQEEFLQAITEKQNHVGWKGTPGAT